MKLRNFIFYIIFEIFLIGNFFSVVSAQEINGFASAKMRDEWMLTALKENNEDTTKSIHGQLIMQRFSDGYYIIMNPIKWNPPKYGEYSKFKPVVVPIGFVTDLASIPQPFWSLAPRDGDYVRAAVIHDYLYWIQDRGREESDSILKEGMEYLHTKYINRNAIYMGVRNFGENAWKKNLENKSYGEIRIINKFPGDDENLTWKQWKKNINLAK